MAERVDLDAVQAICEPTALVPGFDGTGMRVLMDANSQAVVIRLRDLQRLLVAMVAELRVAREELAASRVLLDDLDDSATEADAERYIAARDAYDQATARSGPAAGHADPSIHDRSGPGDG